MSNGDRDQEPTPPVAPQAYVPQPSASVRYERRLNGTEIVIDVTCSGPDREAAATRIALALGIATESISRN